jgi:hypothetical protein
MNGRDYQLFASDSTSVEAIIFEVVQGAESSRREYIEERLSPLSSLVRYIYTTSDQHNRLLLV